MSAFDSADIDESIDFEAKLAVGRDGKGELPKSIWPSYSAFANTQGGEILLGVRQLEDGFEVAGIEDVDKVLDDLWSMLNDPAKISVNLLGSDGVKTFETEDGKWVVRISVPRAARQQRPVFINGNPIGGTYRRDHTGDYRCSDEQVSGLFAEQSEESRDARRLTGYGLGELDLESLHAYRNRFSAAKADHPFNAEDDIGFLRCIGGWFEDKSSGEQGLTLAGLLMFGRGESISLELPNYFVDFRECDNRDYKIEWSHRVVPDGTWSGNLFDFYRKVIQHLFRGLKVPFKLEKDQRIDETPIHKALRESLVNTLVHADYTDRVSILVVKAPGIYQFRNPGLMRVSVEDAMRGGTSDCRNRRLQKMFSLLGLGEQAGSGIPRVISHWRSQHFRLPELQENEKLSTTELRLRTISLLPQDALENLVGGFGSAFDHLDEHAQIALVTAEVEGFVSNARMQQICALHPRDITTLLRQLVDAGFLVVDGRGRATTYSLRNFSKDEFSRKGHPPLFQAALPLPAPVAYDVSPPTKHDSPPTKSHSPPTSERAAHRHRHDSHSGTVSDDEKASSSRVELWSDTRLWAKLKIVAAPVSEKPRALPEVTRRVILEICLDQFLSLAQIADLLRRQSEGLRNRYISEMVREGLLKRRFPQQPSHESQAYLTTEAGADLLKRSEQR